jgi:NAD(P)-dependent dehydrogenase (short-subunit alcohol dehydrogenase family)
MPKPLGFPDIRGGQEGTKQSTRQKTAGLADRITRCNRMAAGVVSTPMATELPAPVGDIAKGTPTDAPRPIGRRVRPGDWSWAVQIVASEHVSFITGHSVVVDGGQPVAALNHPLGARRWI